jgi:hypothetical protein
MKVYIEYRGVVVNTPLYLEDSKFHKYRFGRSEVIRGRGHAHTDANTHTYTHRAS